MHDYGYLDASPRWDDSCIWRPVARALSTLPRGSRVFELGCGNGVAASRMHSMGFDVTAVDQSWSGVEAARRAYPGPRFEQGSTDDEDEQLAVRFGTFDALVSIEVVEHCYSAEHFAECCSELLLPGGLLVLTTPFHGYLKNLALAVTGKLDAHFEATRTGGHIKFFSERTLRELFAGWKIERIERAGRIAPFAKSMILVARKP